MSGKRGESVAVYVVREKGGWLLAVTSDKSAALQTMMPGDVLTEEIVWVSA